MADLARAFGRSYTTVREWVLFGRDPEDSTILKRLAVLEHYPLAPVAYRRRRILEAWEDD